MRTFGVVAILCFVISGVLGACGPEPPEPAESEPEQGTLAGVVVTTGAGPLAEGTGLSGATVTVDEQSLDTDDDGAFQFDELEPGEYGVDVAIPDYGFPGDSADVQARPVVEIETGETTEVILEMEWNPDCEDDELQWQPAGEQLDCFPVCDNYGEGECASGQYCDEEVGACLADECPDGERSRNVDGEVSCYQECVEHEDCEHLKHCSDHGLCKPGCPEGTREYELGGYTICRVICEDDEECDDGEFCHDDEVCLPDSAADPEPVFPGVDYPPLTCGDSPQPDRCSQDPDGFDFEPASFVTQLAVADTDCCYDYTGDGEPDNVIHDLFEVGDGVGAINDQMADAIDDGLLKLVFEHDGLEQLDDSQEFDVNILDAVSYNETDDEVVVDSASFDDGTHPRYMIPNGEISEPATELVMTAAPGRLLVDEALPLARAFTFGADVDIELDYVVLEATPIASSAGVEGGVILDSGTLSGVVLYENVVKSLNTAITGCDCLNNPAELIDPATDQCVLDADTVAMGDDCDGDEERCGILAELCGLFAVIPSMTDVDTNGDGDEDGFSVGMTFDAEAVTIVDVAD